MLTLLSKFEHSLAPLLRSRSDWVAAGFMVACFLVLMIGIKRKKKDESRYARFVPLNRFAEQEDEMEQRRRWL